MPFPHSVLLQIDSVPVHMMQSSNGILMQKLVKKKASTRQANLALLKKHRDGCVQPTNHIRPNHNLERPFVPAMYGPDPYSSCGSISMFDGFTNIRPYRVMFLPPFPAAVLVLSSALLPAPSP